MNCIKTLKASKRIFWCYVIYLYLLFPFVRVGLPGIYPVSGAFPPPHISLLYDRWSLKCVRIGILKTVLGVQHTGCFSFLVGRHVGLIISFPAGCIRGNIMI